MQRSNAARHLEGRIAGARQTRSAQIHPVLEWLVAGSPEHAVAQTGDAAPPHQGRSKRDPEPVQQSPRKLSLLGEPQILHSVHGYSLPDAASLDHAVPRRSAWQLSAILWIEQAVRYGDQAAIPRFCREVLVRL